MGLLTGEYVYVGQERLRRGFTSGTAAALAARAATRMLLSGEAPETLSLTTPKGEEVEAPVALSEAGEGWARCGVCKDGGDDVDATDGLLVCARVSRSDEAGVAIEGGEGVGRVTKPGLDQPLGQAAINSGPRAMIREQVEDESAEQGYAGGLSVVVDVPEGREVARRTFNPQLGIEGGVSILGTTGVVEPRSLAALRDSIEVEVRQQAALGSRRLLLVPGNYGDAFASQVPELSGAPRVSCANYIGFSLDCAVRYGFEQVVLVGHLGKLVKVAGGVMDTHSKTADCRREIFTAHAALAGADSACARELMDAATSDACLDVLEEHGLLEAVLSSLSDAIGKAVEGRCGGACESGAVFFTNKRGLLGMSDGARRILASWREGA